MRISMFKVPSHRVFNHTPIYYDEAKEKQAERLHNAREELGMLTEEEKLAAVGARIRGGIKRRKSDFFEQTYSEKKKSTLRLFIIIVALGAIAYYLMGEFKDEIFELLF